MFAQRVELLTLRFWGSTDNPPFVPRPHCFLSRRENLTSTFRSERIPNRMILQATSPPATEPSPAVSPYTHALAQCPSVDREYEQNGQQGARKEPLGQSSTALFYQGASFRARGRTVVHTQDCSISGASARLDYPRAGSGRHQRTRYAACSCM